MWKNNGGMIDDVIMDTGNPSVCPSPDTSGTAEIQHKESHREAESIRL